MPAVVDHPVFLQPTDPEGKVWRYMDLAKFVAILQQRALYFTRLDQIQRVDPYEGSLSKLEYDKLKASAMEGETNGMIPPAWRGRYFDILMRNARVAIKSNYVSCWHLGDDESAAMWTLYAGTGFGIAIQSTYARLVSVLPGELPRPCYVGLISYTDHRIEAMPQGNAFYPVMHKRRAFAHEREVRAVVWLGDPGFGAEDKLLAYPQGLTVPIDLKLLIERVYVSPSAPHWLTEVVVGLTAIYGVDSPVVASELLSKPFI